MSVKTLGEVAESYFQTLNPIAERISTDIESIRDAYEGLWSSLSNREKEQIINETVIYPEAILKYTLGSQSHEFPSLNTREITGAKFVIDEQTGLSWRDEHSAPFSWKTPSQIDLRIFGTSKIESPTKPQVTKNIFQVKSKESTKLENGITNHDTDLWAHKVLSEKNGIKKNIDTPDSPNIVLGGTSSKISGLCSKLKFLPGKSCSYEVKTVISYPPNTPNSNNLLDKIKGSAVLKLQNTIKLVGGKTYVAAEKKSANETETENLVQTKNTITVTKLQKPSPKVAKPKSPPPPPPILKAKLEETDGNEAGKTNNMIVVKNNKTDKSLPLKDDMETVALLEDNSLSSFRSGDHDSISFDKVTHDLSDELNSLSTDFTPLSGPSDNIPKSGFDFLDNW